VPATARAVVLYCRHGAVKNFRARRFFSGQHFCCAALRATSRRKVTLKYAQQNRRANKDLTTTRERDPEKSYAAGILTSAPIKIFGHVVLPARLTIS
jgi:hypothetical protein